MKHGKINLWETHSATVFSIALVLFIFAFLLIVEYHSYQQTHEMQERITFKVDLVADIDDASAQKLKREIEGISYVKHVDYISRDDAAQLFAEELNDDFVGFIGYNPLYPSMMVNLRADLVPEMRPKVIEQFKKDASELVYVTGVTYQENVVNKLNEVFYRTTWFLIVFIVLLVIVSILMIRSTISIALYAQRETLSTMRLVGAKQSFIARPFLWKAVLYGFLGGLFACIALVLTVLAFSQELTTLNLLSPEHFVWYGAIALFTLLVGIFISWLSTYFAVRKYLYNE